MVLPTKVTFSESNGSAHHDNIKKGVSGTHPRLTVKSVRNQLSDHFFVVKPQSNVDCSRSRALSRSVFARMGIIHRDIIQNETLSSCITLQALMVRHT